MMFLINIGVDSLLLNKVKHGTYNQAISHQIIGKKPLTYKKMKMMWKAVILTDFIHKFKITKISFFNHNKKKESILN